MRILLLFVFTWLGLNVMAQQTQKIDLSTGVVNGSTSLFNPGDTDDSWEVTRPNGTTAMAKCCTPISGWATNSNCGTWITSDLVNWQTQAALDPGKGIYTYKLTFNSYNQAVCNAQMVLNFAGGDNTLTKISVNGTDFPQNNIHFSPFAQNIAINLAPSAILVNTLNTVIVTVDNTDGPTGLFLCGNLIIDYVGLTPVITGNSNFCAGAPLTFTGSCPKASNTFWEIAQSDKYGNVQSGGYSWNNNGAWYSGAPGVFTFPGNVVPPCNSYYKIKLAVINACTGWTEINKVVYISCNPSVTVSGSQVACGASSVLLTADGTATTYSWSPINQTGKQVVVHPAMDCGSNCGGDNKMNYTVTGTNSYGCLSTATYGVKPYPQNLMIDISTGVDPTGALITYGTKDPDWKVRGMAGNSLYNTTSFANLFPATVVTQYPGMWVGTASERWITTTNRGTDPYDAGPSQPSTGVYANYWYENRFTIPSGVGYGNLLLKIVRMSADNSASVFFNSPNAPYTSGIVRDFYVVNPTSSLTTCQNFYGPYNITDPVKFKIGENVLQVSVYNEENKNTPTGFIMNGAVTASCPVTEACLAPVINISGSNTICPGHTSVTLSTQYSSPNLQWERMECGGSFTPISGAYLSSYTATTAGSSGTVYRLKLTCNGAVYYSNYLVVFSVPNCNGSPMACYNSEARTTTSVETNEKSAAVSIYPNPFSQNFSAVYNGEGAVKVLIQDVCGKVILMQTGIAKEEMKLEMKDVPAGIYFIKITAEGTTIVKKIIKE
jgi:hypothetical protein